ncbi:MAG: hypothetical protein BGO69_06295 [Bacteroidetes bacterium 46-16]|nr:MAG: hypothetical protein BGO69_06295 [Bacteroidetes bacterium 46-16]
MKIRIKGDSLRMRLSRSEVDKFGKDGYIEEITHFGKNTFRYALESRKELDQLAAAFADNRITLLVPDAIREEWVHTDVVGYNNNMDIGEGKKLYLLLEKDFKCIDAEVLEDQSDNYENPLASCQ